MAYFNGIDNMEDLRKAYKKLSKELHPDLNEGKEEDFKKMLNEYHEIKKNGFKTNTNTDNNQAKYDYNNLSDAMKKAVMAVINLEGVIVEIVGSWVWLSGDTYKHKDILKTNGFKWGAKKKMWYFTETKRKGGYSKRKSMNDIRNTYGSKKAEKETIHKIKK